MAPFLKISRFPLTGSRVCALLRQVSNTAYIHPEDQEVIVSTFPNLLPGQQLPQGTIVDRTTTSYKVETDTGEAVFVPFYGPNGVHALKPATPLVTFTD